MWKDKGKEGVKRDWFYVITYLSPCILNAKCLPPFPSPTHTPKQHQKTLNNSINFIVEMTKKKKRIYRFYYGAVSVFPCCKDQYEQILRVSSTNKYTYTHTSRLKYILFPSFP